MLTLQQAGNDLLVGPLVHLLCVRRQLLGDDGAADVDERFEHRIALPTIFSLNMVDLTLVLHVCVEACDHPVCKVT